MGNSQKIVYLGAGCFWHAEKEYATLNGIYETEVGWVDFDNEGRVEVIKITYNPDHITIDDIINKFWKIHDPESKKNNDVNYIERSKLVANNNQQLEKLSKLLDIKKSDNPDITTTISMMGNYVKAPDKDQKYYLE